jgi:hypothetical protein
MFGPMSEDYKSLCTRRNDSGPLNTRLYLLPSSGQMYYVAAVLRNVYHSDTKSQTVKPSKPASLPHCTSSTPEGGNCVVNLYFGAKPIPYHTDLQEPCDVFGCGYNTEISVLFFTRNGTKYPKDISISSTIPLYAAIGFNSWSGEKPWVQVNFGKTLVRKSSNSISTAIRR